MGFAPNPLSTLTFQIEESTLYSVVENKESASSDKLKEVQGWASTEKVTRN